MLKSLIRKGIGKIMLNCLVKMYSLTICIIQGCGQIQSTVGIRQGATTSCYLFIMFIDDIFDSIAMIFNSDDFIQLFHILLHADDTLVLASTYEGLQKKLLFVEDMYLKKSLKLNYGKCKYMVLGSKKLIHNSRYLINLRHGFVKFSEKEKFLGCFFMNCETTLTNIKEDLKNRAPEVRIKLNNFLHNNFNLSFKTKRQVFDACFTSKVIYGCESWGRSSPNNYKTLYNYGIKNVLGIRLSTLIILHI